ncbi:MAG: hypothetical protein LC796_14570 [Acidobacteria bacterium]|nr:hypothetical protein [Acidobacteriota bacterium]MCA1609573.1 hypothetical protein [Acidobacteriota bacterium]
MLLLSLALLLLAGPAPEAARPPAQMQADEYTRYELLGPETSQFRVVYDVTATSAGATHYFNPIRKGSEASRESVTDRMSGDALKFEIVSAEEARRTGLADAEADTQYIRVRLPRPVPAGGQVRLRIDKTYRDPASYLREGDEIAFVRSLGIKRNTIVLPAGYELLRCNVPSQVLTEPGGRIAVSFVNSNPEQAALSIRARRLPQ